MASKKKAEAAAAVLKQILISTVSGLGLCLILSLIAAAAAAKSDSALSLGMPAACICVFGGSLLSAAVGVKTGGSAAAGTYSGLAFAAVLLLLSLCTGGESPHPLPLLLAAAAGTALGLLIFGRKKADARKKLKKYLKKA